MRLFIIGTVIALFMGPLTVHAQGISQLDQWKSTTTPYSALTTLIDGKNLYLPRSNATTSTQTANRFCLTADTCITTWPSSGLSFSYPFPSNATTTALTFTNGASVAKLTNLTSNGFVKTSGGDGTINIDTATYLTSALTSLNGLTGATQTFATTSTAGGFGFSSVGTTHTLNIPTASATTVLGLLSSTDWTTFNNKSGFSYLFPNNATTTLLTFSGGASTTAFSSNTLAVGQTATTTITSAGFVGVGSSSPWAKLSVTGTNTSSATAGFVIADSANAPKAIFTNGGQLLMGTTTNYGLAIPMQIGGAVGGGAWIRMCREDGSFFCTFWNSGNGAFNQVQTGTGFFTVSNGATFSGGSFSGGTQVIAIRGNTLLVGTSTNNSTTGGHLGIWGTNGFSNYFSVTDPSVGNSYFGDVFQITSAGRVGVGTTTPYAQLSVATPSGATGSLTTLFAIASSTASATTTLFAVNNKGYVGIGTTTPRAMLEIVDNGTIASDGTTAVMTVHAASASPYLGAFFNDAYSRTVPLLQYFGWTNAATNVSGILGGDFEMGNAAANKLVFYTNGYASPRMSITGTGLVGIGTTSPTQALLTVATPNGATGSLSNLFRIASSTPTATTTLFNIDNKGQVSNTSAGVTGLLAPFKEGGYLLASSTMGTGTTTKKFSGWSAATTYTKFGCTSSGSGTFVAVLGDSNSSTTPVVSGTSLTTTFTTMSSNNAFTAGEAVWIAYGSVSGTVVDPSCSYQRTVDAQ